MGGAKICLWTDFRERLWSGVWSVLESIWRTSGSVRPRNIRGSRTRRLVAYVYAAAESPGNAHTAAELVAASVAMTLATLVVYETLVRRQRTRQGDWS